MFTFPTSALPLPCAARESPVLASRLHSIDLHLIRKLDDEVPQTLVLRPRARFLIRSFEALLGPSFLRCLDWPIEAEDDRVFFRYACLSAVSLLASSSRYHLVPLPVHLVFRPRRGLRAWRSGGCGAEPCTAPQTHDSFSRFVSANVP